MRLFLGLSLTALLLGCHHFDPMDSVRQAKVLNIAVINTPSYALIPGAQCHIYTDNESNNTNSRKTFTTTSNPAALMLDLDYHSLSVTCQAPGYTQTALAITNRIQHWSAEDLFWLPPGNIVNNYSNLLPYYPAHIVVLMSKTPLTAAATVENLYQQKKPLEPIFQGTV